MHNSLFKFITFQYKNNKNQKYQYYVEIIELIKPNGSELPIFIMCLHFISNITMFLWDVFFEIKWLQFCFTIES